MQKALDIGSQPPLKISHNVKVFVRKNTMLPLKAGFVAALFEQLNSRDNSLETIKRTSVGTPITLLWGLDSGHICVCAYVYILPT